MRKIFSFLLAGTIAFGVTSCTKDERSLPTTPGGGSLVPTNEQRAVVVNISATWCGPCGSWGIPGFYNAINIDSTRVFGIKSTANDDLDVPVGGPINDLLISGGYPSFAVGISKQSGTSQTNTAVNTLLAKLPADVTAGVAIRKTVSGDKLTVSSAVKFFKASTGTYHLALYVTENNVMNTQNGITGIYAHKHVLRAEMEDSSWGTPISASTSFTENQTVTGNYEYTIPSNQKAADIKIVAVLYKMTGSTPTEYINADMK